MVLKIVKLTDLTPRNEIRAKVLRQGVGVGIVALGGGQKWSFSRLREKAKIAPVGWKVNLASR